MSRAGGPPVDSSGPRRDREFHAGDRVFVPAGSSWEECVVESASTDGQSRRVLVRRQFGDRGLFGPFSANEVVAAEDIDWIPPPASAIQHSLYRVKVNAALARLLPGLTVRPHVWPATYAGEPADLGVFDDSLLVLRVGPRAWMPRRKAFEWSIHQLFAAAARGDPTLLVTDWEPTASERALLDGGGIPSVRWRDHRDDPRLADAVTLIRRSGRT